MQKSMPMFYEINMAIAAIISMLGNIIHLFLPSRSMGGLIVSGTSGGLHIGYAGAGMVPAEPGGTCHCWAPLGPFHGATALRSGSERPESRGSVPEGPLAYCVRPARGPLDRLSGDRPLANGCLTVSQTLAILPFKEVISPWAARRQ